MEPGVSHERHPQVLILFQYMCLYVVFFWGAYVLHLTSVGVRGQLVGIDSVLLLCGFGVYLRTPGLVQEAPSLI